MRQSVREHWQPTPTWHPSVPRQLFLGTSAACASLRAWACAYWRGTSNAHSRCEGHIVTMRNPDRSDLYSDKKKQNIDLHCLSPCEERKSNHMGSFSITRHLPARLWEMTVENSSPSHQVTCSLKAEACGTDRTRTLLRRPAGWSCCMSVVLWVHRSGPKYVLGICMGRSHTRSACAE